MELLNKLRYQPTGILEWCLKETKNKGWGQTSFLGLFGIGSMYPSPILVWSLVRFWSPVLCVVAALHRFRELVPALMSPRKLKSFLFA